MPRAKQRLDARDFFASVPLRYEHVAFPNHEVLPSESLEVNDWFGDCTLFKVSPHMLADFIGSDVDPTGPKCRHVAALPRLRCCPFAVLLCC